MGEQEGFRKAANPLLLLKQYKMIEEIKE